MKSRHFLLLVAYLFLFFTLRISAQTQYPFQDPNLPLEERVNNIVSLLTLDEDEILQKANEWRTKVYAADPH